MNLRKIILSMLILLLTDLFAQGHRIEINTSLSSSNNIEKPVIFLIKDYLNSSSNTPICFSMRVSSYGSISGNRAQLTIILENGDKIIKNVSSNNTSPNTSPNVLIFFLTEADYISISTLRIAYIQISDSTQKEIYSKYLTNDESINLVGISSQSMPDIQTLPTDSVSSGN